MSPRSGPRADRLNRQVTLMTLAVVISIILLRRFSGDRET